MKSRRSLLAGLPVVASAGLASAGPTPAAKPASAAERFPGDPPQHHIVYQLNRGEPDYIEHILNSVGAVIGKYADNVAVEVVAFAAGIHLLARKPLRPVPEALRERARSQARSYGVTFVACGNTMKTLGWTATEIVDFARVDEVGAATIMELQEQGWAYIAW